MKRLSGHAEAWDKPTPMQYFMTRSQSLLSVLTEIVTALLDHGIEPYDTEELEAIEDLANHCSLVLSHRHMRGLDVNLVYPPFAVDDTGTYVIVWDDLPWLARAA